MQEGLLSPVARQSVADGVHEQLRRAILDGLLAPGSALPGERELSTRFEVNRHAVRQAVGRLAQAGLVTVSHGGATRVNDWRRTAGLDVLADLAFGEGGRLPDGDVLRSALEMRFGIGVDVARRAAGRATPEVVGALRAHVEAGRAAAELDEAERHYAALWQELVEGSRNVAYRLALNSLVRALDQSRELTLELSALEVRDHAAQHALVDAVEAGDGDRAAALAADLLGRMPAAAERLLEAAA
ncbi:FadR/GntR family transcriptional regulator [Conexibacter sp. SYSU D00693]|uniref:FadR/GntR family transcriptional regulator n=1 Tax=Conexibacter sp. SYSU D00693 TaxID=2812560 RepID=UPI00196AFA0A|nr:GntR family transcriptional regulator [Conexibacter sp. SYSU D00693]